MSPLAWALSAIGAFGAVIGTCWFVWWLLERRRTKAVDPTVVAQIQEEVHQVKTELGRIAEYIDGLPTSANKNVRDLFNEGMVRKERYGYSKAIDLFRQALVLEPAESERAALLILIGNCFLGRSELEEAERHYKEAEEVAREANDLRGLAAALGNMGVVYQARGDYNQALEWYNKSIAITEKIGDQAGLSTTYSNIGLIYRARGDYDQALEFAQKELHIAEDIGIKPQIEQIKRNIQHLKKGRKK